MYTVCYEKVFAKKAILLNRENILQGRFTEILPDSSVLTHYSWEKQRHLLPTAVPAHVTAVTETAGNIQSFLFSLPGFSFSLSNVPWSFLHTVFWVGFFFFFPCWTTYCMNQDFWTGMGRALREIQASRAIFSCTEYSKILKSKAFNTFLLPISPASYLFPMVRTVLQSSDQLSHKANPQLSGDVGLHFSGHGSKQPTVRPLVSDQLFSSLACRGHQTARLGNAALPLRH